MSMYDDSDAPSDVIQDISNTYPDGDQTAITFRGEQPEPCRICGEERRCLEFHHPSWKYAGTAICSPCVGKFWRARLRMHFAITPRAEQMLAPYNAETAKHDKNDVSELKETIGFGCFGLFMVFGGVALIMGGIGGLAASGGRSAILWPLGGLQVFIGLTMMGVFDWLG